MRKICIFAADDRISYFTDRNSRIVTQLSAAQGRVPATNVLNFRWRYMPPDVGMSQRIPSAPVICYRRKRKLGTIQLNKVWPF